MFFEQFTFISNTGNDTVNLQNKSDVFPIYSQICLIFTLICNFLENYIYLNSYDEVRSDLYSLVLFEWVTSENVVYGQFSKGVYAESSERDKRSKRGLSNPIEQYDQVGHTRCP